MPGVSPGSSTTAECSLRLIVKVTDEVTTESKEVALFITTAAVVRYVL